MNRILIAFLLCLPMFVAGQTYHPMHFGVNAHGVSVPNWYANYQGITVRVVAPSTIVGDVNYYAANSGTGASTDWGGTGVNITDTVKMAPSGDTEGCSAVTSGYYSGKIAIVYRGTCEFSYKALVAQNGGAAAVIVINTVPGGPLTMGTGSYGSSITIPVFMISKDDGAAIVNQIRSSVPVVMNINTFWRSGYANDLKIVKGGYSTSAYYSVPWQMLNVHPANSAYANINGLFVANVGNNNASHVKMVGALTFNPTRGAPFLARLDSMVLNNFPSTDSIWSLYGNTYNLPTITGPGRFDLQYNLRSDSTDNNTIDNSYKYSFFASDSIMSKGKYDFVNNRPVVEAYVTPSSSSPVIWSVPYFIAKGGYILKNVQFSASTTAWTFGTGSVTNLYVYKWTDGRVASDSLIQNGELSLVGLARKVYNDTVDSIYQTFTVPVGDTSGLPATIVLDSNSWYVVGAEMNAGWALGFDGYLNGHVRSCGLQHRGVKEYYNPIWLGDRYTSTNSQLANPTGSMYPWAFDGTGSYAIDSVVFRNEAGLVPAIALNLQPCITPDAGTITGSSIVCTSGAVPMFDSAAGGVWSSTDTSIARVSATGVVTAVRDGVDTILYTISNACGTAIARRPINVYSPLSPGTITGVDSVCVASSITLTDTTSGGTWSSVRPTVASVSSGGLVVGIAGGLDTILYSVTNTCGTVSAMKTVYVIALPTVSSVSGSDSVCQFATITMRDTTTGGVWSVSSSYGASISSAGVVTGLHEGLDTAIYTTSNRCGIATAKKWFYVKPAPNSGAIVGASAVCMTDTLRLSDSATGGIWSSVFPAIATVTTTGIVIPVSVGVDTIKYTASNSCGVSVATKVINVNPLPRVSAISGPTIVCEGATITLSDSVSGGVWTSSTTSVATIASTGVVTGRVAGVDTIKYTYTNSCGTVFTTRVIAVNPLPHVGVITGASSVCPDSSISLHDTITGGYWAVSNSLASITSSGVLIGVNPGSVTVFYVDSNICGRDTARHSVTVNPRTTAGVITGADSVCIDSVVILHASVTGGIWEVSNSNASITSSGVVTGAGLGVDTVKYTVTGTCGVAVITKLIKVYDCHLLTQNVRLPVVSVYPNPVSGLLTIDAMDWAVNFNVTLSTLDGRCVVSKTQQQLKSVIDVTGLAKGVYILTLNREAEVSLKKTIVVE